VVKNQVGAAADTSAFRRFATSGKAEFSQERDPTASAVSIGANPAFGCYADGKYCIKISSSDSIE
jgi:hypothetical protein